MSDGHGLFLLTLQQQQQHLPQKSEKITAPLAWLGGEGVHYIIHCCSARVSWRREGFKICGVKRVVVVWGGVPTLLPNDVEAEGLGRVVLDACDCCAPYSLRCSAKATLLNLDF